MSPTIDMTDEFSHALKLLEDGEHLFLTGKAGTGKSTLIREFMRRTERNVVVTAPTGIAALNVGGYTLHRLFGIHPKNTTLEQVRSGDYFPGRFASVIKQLETLIIDEASMIRADLFDMIALALRRFGPQPGRPFGGVQVVLVGDLLQLPPVVQDSERTYFETAYTTPYFFSAEHYSDQAFPTAALTRVFRQLGDDQMTSILNSIREGVLLGTAAQDLKSRLDPSFEPPDDEFWLTLTTTNRIANARNRDRLDRLTAELHQHHAQIEGSTGHFDAPAEEALSYKVGAQIMLLTNDPADRWVNGTLGRILGTGTSEDGETYVQVRVRSNQADEDGHTVVVYPHTWEITEPVVEGGSLTHQVVGTFTQLPFRLAWAITIHKSQGQTLDRLVVDLSGGTFAFGQLYVALSRATSLNGLVLRREVLPKDLKTDRRVLRFLRRSTGQREEQRHCALSLLTVGEEGRMSRPRPVELAIAFDDGSATTTLINPQRDIADARTAYGISTSDVLLAPTLAEAWSLISPTLEGHTPVGPDVDRTMGLIDSELKRLGEVVPLPMGIETGPSEKLPASAPSRASDLAQDALDSFRKAPVQDASATAFTGADLATVEVGYLLSRDSQLSTPSFDHLPGLAALIDVCRQASPALLGHDAESPLPDAEEESWHAAARQGLSEQLQRIVNRQALPPEAITRLERAGETLRHPLTLTQETAGTVSAAEILADGTRICFTGTATDSTGRQWGRTEMEDLAERQGLIPVGSVTKTRCEVLVVAELGTQSGKAKKAQEYQKPILSADDFFAWAGTVVRAHAQ